MGIHRKGQLFIVTSVFIIGIFFIVLQNLLQYSAIDVSEPMKVNDYYIFKSMPEVANNSLRTTLYCNETKDNLEKNMEELKIFLEKSYIPGVQSINFGYSIDCANWETDKIVNITISMIGFGKEMRGNYQLHKI
jgi:hypothetical protein